MAYVPDVPAKTVCLSGEAFHTPIDTRVYCGDPENKTCLYQVLSHTPCETSHTPVEVTPHLHHHPTE